MATIQETPISSSGSLLLNVGQNPDTGKTMTKKCNISGLVADPDNEKLFNVASAVSDIMKDPVMRIQKNVSVELEEV